MFKCKLNIAKSIIKSHFLTLESAFYFGIIFNIKGLLRTGQFACAGERTQVNKQGLAAGARGGRHEPGSHVTACT